MDNEQQQPDRVQAAVATDERIVLRPVQERAVEAVRQQLRNGCRRVLLVAPTGFGKTAVASELIRRCVERGKKVIFLVHRREIVRDTARRLFRAGVACGIVMADERLTANVSTLVCSVQTLATRGDRPAADVLLWDEAHHCAARTYREIAAHYPGALHIGLTATPERADGTGLADMFDQLVVGATPRQLIAENLLVPCDVTAPVRRTNPSLAIDEIEAYRKHADSKPAVIFAKNVNHARTLAGRFRDEAGIASACVHGKTGKRERDTALEQFATGTIQVLVNVFVLTEGWDAPRAQVCILARNCGSAPTFLQIVGRVLRIYPGKERAHLIDLCGSVYQHGLPDEDRRFSLDGKPISQTSAPPLLTCPVCAAAFRSSPKCPRCGYEFPKSPAPTIPAIAQVEMVRIAGKARRDQQLARWYRLVYQCVARGHKPGWASHRFRDAFGSWPPNDFPKYEKIAAELPTGIDPKRRFF